MKTVILFILFFFTNPSVTEIRKLYKTAAVTENDAKVMAEKLSDISREDNNKVLIAYKGASIIILSKLEKKIGDKSKKFKEGASLLEYAVTAEPNSAEIRMIRLSIQENVPKVVNYRGNKKEDIKFLLDHYKEQTGAVKAYIGQFIAQSTSFTAIEKQMVE